MSQKKKKNKHAESVPPGQGDGLNQRWTLDLIDALTEARELALEDGNEVIVLEDERLTVMSVDYGDSLRVGLLLPERGLEVMLDVDVWEAITVALENVREDGDVYRTDEAVLERTDFEDQPAYSLMIKGQRGIGQLNLVLLKEDVDLLKQGADALADYWLDNA